MINDYINKKRYTCVHNGLKKMINVTGTYNRRHQTAYKMCEII